MKKRFSDTFSILLLLVVGVYFLYQKGYILVNFERLHVKQAYELLQTQADTVLLLDVRTQEEYLSDGRIKGSMLIPLSVLEKNLDKLKIYKERKILIYCRSGSRSISASRTLSDYGFKAYNIDGGINEWKSEGLPL